MRNRPLFLVIASLLFPAACASIVGLPDVPTPAEAREAGGSRRAEPSDSSASADRFEGIDRALSCAPEADASPDDRAPSSGDGENDAAPRCGELDVGQELALGQSVSSCDDRFSLTMEPDGNLVLSFQGTVLWAANSAEAHGVLAVMQADGNLVVSDASGSPLWSSATYGYAGAYLKIQNDGNLVISCGGQPIWASGTCCH
jgi:hypothetical protein